MENIRIYLSKNFPHLTIDVINEVIEVAKEDILNYCHIEEVPTGLNKTWLTMCIHQANTINSAGIVNESGGNINISLDFDYPTRVFNSLREYRKFG